MKTVLVLELNTGHYVIPTATTTDAGKLLALLGSAIPVRLNYGLSGRRSRYEVRDEDAEHFDLNPKVSMVPSSDVSMPSPVKDEATRSQRAKPVQAISGRRVLRLEGGVR